MFNRSEILRSAWAAYRVARPAVYAAGDTASNRTFLRSLFAKMLRNAWAAAKKSARSLTNTAAAFVEAQRRVQVATAAAMDPMARSARIVEIRSELTALDYRRSECGLLIAATTLAPNSTSSNTPQLSPPSVRSLTSAQC